MNKHYNLLALAPITMLTQIQPAHAVEYLTVEQAQKAMFKDSNSFSARTILFSKEQKDEIKKISGVNAANDKQQFWKVFKGSQFNGYFVLDQVYGKHELITYAVAIDANGIVKAVDILQYRESYGNEIKDEAWRQQFIGKKSTDKFVLDEDIQNISGATLSCKHVSDGVKRVLTVYELYLKKSQ